MCVQGELELDQNLTWFDLVNFLKVEMPCFYYFYQRQTKKQNKVGPVVHERDSYYLPVTIGFTLFGEKKLSGENL